MMVKTVVKFRDKKTGEIREVGDEFRVSKARYEEILQVGQFVEPVEKKEDGGEE